jgi:methylmalonyl-CoA mutase
VKSDVSSTASEPDLARMQALASASASWRAQAAKELQGQPVERLTTRSAEGVVIEPLYSAEPTALPGRELLLGRAGWMVCPEYRQPKVADAAAAIAADLGRGAQAVWIELDERIACGVMGAPGPVGRRGVAVCDAGELQELLAGIAEDTPVTLAVGRGGAAVLHQMSRRRGTIGYDPLGVLARRGALSGSIEHVLEHMLQISRDVLEEGLPLRTALVDVGAYHEAGATAADQIAALLATGTAYLRALVAGGISVGDAAKQIAFAAAVGRDVFFEIAKLRALRLAWARVVGACGGDAAAQRMQLHVRGSWRERSTVDPWVGLLRGTGETFAAALGGADSIATTAMDEAFGEPGELGRRMAVNTQVVLAEEAHLGRVADPAGGSGYVEALTDQLARIGWGRFQEIERVGGMAAALRAGLVQGWAAEAAKLQAAAVASVRVPIVGVSRFAARDERATGATAASDVLAEVSLNGVWGGSGDSLRFGAAVEQVPALVRARLAEPFEALRASARGETVALVAVGEPGEWRGRVEFCRAYFGVGGFVAVETAGAVEVDEVVRQFAATGARAAVICSADAVYENAVPRLVPALRAAGASVVLLAGRPKAMVEAMTAAGIDLFVQLGGDAVAVLGELQRRLEVRA